MSAKDKAILAALSAGYTADNDGRIVKPDGSLQKECLSVGYRLFGVPASLCGSSNSVTVKSHRFVAAFHFGVEALKSDCISHLDGDTGNNSPSNLAYGDAPKAGVKTCQNCGIEFKTYNKRSSSCSLKCRPRYPIDLLNRAAAEARLLKPKSDKPQYFRKYNCATCGVECKAHSKRKYCAEHTKPVGPQKKEKVCNKTCALCGSQYHSYSKRRKYCSYECHINSGGARRAGDASARAIMKYGAKKDANHKEIVDAFERLGSAVLDLSSMGCGVPDLIVSCKGRWHLVDVKNPDTSYGKRGLNQRQREWAAAWKGGPVYLVSSIDDVINMVNGNLGAVKSSEKAETVVMRIRSP